MMYKLGKYKSTDRMSDLISENYPVLLVLSRFGIPLGVGDKTVGEVCQENEVNVQVFLIIVNLMLNEQESFDASELSGDSDFVRSLVGYLERSHDYFLNYRLPGIRIKLVDAIDYEHDDVSFAILRFYDGYVSEVRKHMSYEDKYVFTYVQTLLEGSPLQDYNIGIFSKQHNQVEARLTELKNILIKYYPGESSNALNGVLFDIFTCERDLAFHIDLEDRLFTPMIEYLEKKKGAKK